MMVQLQPVQPCMDDVRHVQPLCKAHVQTHDLGDGTLYIADSALTWQNPAGHGFQLQYPSIQLHAVSRDTSAFPEQCLYLMVEGSVAGEELSSDDDESADPVAAVSELRLVPSDKDVLQTLYTKLCLAQALHPDPEDEQSDEDDGADWNLGEGDGGLGDQEGALLQQDGMAAMPNMTPEGAIQLERLEAMLNGQHQAQQGGDDQDMETEDAPGGGQFEDCE